MKIYFACAIRGGRDGSEIYPQITEALKKYGQVLTEWFGDQKLTAEGELNIDAKFVHDRDLELVMAADILVAEVTSPSHGVGYEIGKAEEKNKRILCIYRPTPGKRLSAMLAGNDRITTGEYQTLEDLEKIFKEFFK